MLRHRLLCLGILAASASAQSASIYEQAAIHIQNGQPARAIRMLDPHLKQAPQDLRALTLMGMALSAENRTEEGNRYFRQALAGNPAYAPALRNLAMNELSLGHARAALPYFEKLINLTPSDPAARLGLAQACIELNQSMRAFDLLKQMPRDADAAAHFSTGTLLARIERYTAAAHEFELAQNGYPNAYDAGFNLMLAYVKSGQAANAVRIGEGLVARGHRQADLYNLLAQAYESGGRTAEAYDSLRTATTIDPSDAANYLDLIALCLTHRNYDLALEIADIGIARLPKSDRVHLQRGIVLAMKENFDGARAEFETAVALAPERSVPHVALGLMLLQTDRTSDAVVVLRRRVQNNADYLALWFLGEALYRAGVAEGSPVEREAIDALTRSISMRADVAQSRILLAKLLARRGDLDLAEKHLIRALALDPANIGATYQLAQVCQKKGDVERAKALFAKVSKAKTDDREQFLRGGLQHIIRAGSR